MTTAESILECAASLGLSLSYEFVPFSRSRSAGEKHPSLNWKAKLLHNGREVFAFDYTAGSGHAPSYKQGKLTVDEAAAIKWECENGRKARYMAALGAFTNLNAKPIQPNDADVYHSLASDAEAIDCASFDEWASNYGMDADSRKAEATYRECLAQALALRAVIGDAGLSALRKACEGY